MSKRISQNKMFSNPFDRMLFSVASGEVRNLNTALEIMDFAQFGMDIPVGYGFSITLYSPYKAEDWCLDKYDTFACERLISSGGAIVADLSWKGFVLAHCILYFNEEIGIAAIMQPDIGGLNSLLSQGVDTGEAATTLFKQLMNDEYSTLQSHYGDRNYKELIKMQEFLANKVEQEFGIKFVPVLWPNLIEYFNNWYYSGMIRRGYSK